MCRMYGTCWGGSEATLNRSPTRLESPFQRGACPHQPGHFQGQPHRRSRRVASNLRSLTFCHCSETETRSHWSDTTVATENSAFGRRRQIRQGFCNSRATVSKILTNVP